MCKRSILSGSPYSVRADNSLKLDLSSVKGKIPLLGICYGAQYLAHNFGGNVDLSSSREYGRANLVSISEKSSLFDGVKNGSQVWMSHADTIVELPRKSIRIGSTKDVDNAAFKFNDENYLTFNTRRNRNIDLTEYYNLIYEYRNDCLIAGIKYNKSYYEDRDLKPSENLIFSITLTPLTSFEQKIDQ